MRGSYRLLFLSSLNLLVFSSFVSYEDKHSIDYFLHRYAADLYQKKQFNLDYLRVYYGWKTIDRVYLEFSCFRSLTLKQARELIIETANGIIEKINSDPLLQEKGVLPDGHFCITNLYLQIRADNIFARTMDDSGGIQSVSLDGGIITYETFNSSIYMPADKKTFSEQYRDAELLVTKEKGKGTGFEIEEQLEKALQSAKERKVAQEHYLQKQQKETEVNKAEFHVPKTVEYPIEKFNSLFGEKPLPAPQVVTIEDINNLHLPPPPKPEEKPAETKVEEAIPPVPPPSSPLQQVVTGAVSPNQPQPEPQIEPQTKKLPVHLVPLTPQEKVQEEKSASEPPKVENETQEPVKEAQAPEVAPQEPVHQEPVPPEPAPLPEVPPKEVPEAKSVEQPSVEQPPVEQPAAAQPAAPQPEIPEENKEAPTPIPPQSNPAQPNLTQQEGDTKQKSFFNKLASLFWKKKPQEEKQPESTSASETQESVATADEVQEVQPEAQDTVAEQEQEEKVVTEVKTAQAAERKPVVSEYTEDDIVRALQEDISLDALLQDEKETEIETSPEPTVALEEVLEEDGVETEGFWQRLGSFFADDPKSEQKSEQKEEEQLVTKQEPEQEKEQVLQPEKEVATAAIEEVKVSEAPLLQKQEEQVQAVVEDAEVENAEVEDTVATIEEAEIAPYEHTEIAETPVETKDFWQSVRSFFSKETEQEIEQEKEQVLQPEQTEVAKEAASVAAPAAIEEVKVSEASVLEKQQEEVQAEVEVAEVEDAEVEDTVATVEEAEIAPYEHTEIAEAPVDAKSFWQRVRSVFSSDVQSEQKEAMQDADSDQVVAEAETEIAPYEEIEVVTEDNQEQVTQPEAAIEVDAVVETDDDIQDELIALDNADIASSQSETEIEDEDEDAQAKEMSFWQMLSGYIFPKGTQDASDAAQQVHAMHAQGDIKDEKEAVSSFSSSSDAFESSTETDSDEDDEELAILSTQPLQVPEFYQDIVADIEDDVEEETQETIE